MSAAARGRVVVVDDDEVILIACRRVLEKAEFEVHTFDQGHRALEALSALQPIVLLVDLRMPKLDGIAVIERALGLYSDMASVVMTAYATVAAAVDAMKVGAYDMLVKPFTPDELLAVVHRAAERVRLTQEARLLRQEKEEAEAQNRRQRELREAMAELLEERTRFMLQVAHNMRAPLAASVSLLDVLREGYLGELPAEQRLQVERVIQRLELMSQTVSDLLALARDRTADMALVPVDMAALARQVCQVFQEQASSQGVTLQLDLAPADVTVMGDPMMLGQMLENLLSNAIKYSTRGGQVTLRCGPEAAGRVRVEIEDHGIGIPAADREKLFTPFFRAHNARQIAAIGTGLGLVLVQQTVARHHGELRLDSEEHKGTRVVIALPQAASAPAGPDVERPAS